MLIIVKGREVEVENFKVPVDEATANKIVKSMEAAFNMTKQRCLNTNCDDFAYYGGRGIQIDARWLVDFANFVSDMGLRPEGYTLDRVDVNGNYCKENCRWATRMEQTQNRRVDNRVMIPWKGETLSISEWARRLGMAPRTLNARLTKLNYSVEEAFSKEVKPGGLLPGKDYPTIRDSHAKKGVYGHKAWNQPKLTVSHRRVAIALEACGATRSAIAKEFGVTGTTVTNLIEGTGAYDVSNPYFK